MMRRTSSPAILPASLVAWRWTIVEVGRDRDDRLGHRFAQVALGGFLHFLKDVGRNLRRSVLLAARLHPGIAIVGFDDLVRHKTLVLLDGLVAIAPADQALDREYGVFRVGDRLALGRLAGEDLAILCESHHGRGRSGPFRVLDDFGIFAFHDSDAGIGRAKVNANDFGHSDYLSFRQTAQGLESSTQMPHPSPSMSGAGLQVVFDVAKFRLLYRFVTVLHQA